MRAVKFVKTENRFVKTVNFNIVLSNLDYITFWNSIDDDIKDARSLNSFKSKFIIFSQTDFVIFYFRSIRYYFLCSSRNVYMHFVLCSSTIKLQISV